jgi:hypothetical protein
MVPRGTEELVGLLVAKIAVQSHRARREVGHQQGVFFGNRWVSSILRKSCALQGSRLTL